jgi:hypothetical protein
MGIHGYPRDWILFFVCCSCVLIGLQIVRNGNVQTHCCESVRVVDKDTMEWTRVPEAVSCIDNRRQWH